MRAVVLGLALLSACAGLDPDSVETKLSCEVRHNFALLTLRLSMDILVVIDDSPAMAAHQEQLRRDLATIGWMLTFYGTPRDLRIGVVSADPARHGALVGPALVYRDHLGGLETSFEGTLGEALAAQATLGASGAEARPLSAVREALGGANPWPVRANAYLGILIITATDEADPELVSFLATLKGNPSFVIGSVVAPVAASGVRAFAEALGENGSQVALEQDDWSDAVASFPPRDLVLVGLPCLRDEVDWDPSVVCSVTEETWFGPETVLPRCPAARPCWSVVSDPVACPTPSQLRFVVERDDYAPAGTVTVARCATSCPS